MNKNLILGILLSLLSLKATCLQSYMVEDGGVIKGKIYAGSLNRIHLENDRILSIKGLAGQFQADKDDVLGDIYIKPNALQAEDEINLFITSEKGNSYNIILNLMATEPESIQISGKNIYPDEEEKELMGERNQDQAEIIALIKAMYHDNVRHGYKIIDFKEPMYSETKNKLTFSKEKIFEGKNYMGEVIIISNKTKEGKLISEKDLCENHKIVAISMESEFLPKNSYTKAYRVIKNER